MALASESEFPRQGRLQFPDNQLDTATGTIRGRAVFSNDDGALTPGLFVRLRMSWRQAVSSVLIKDQAVGTDLDKDSSTWSATTQSIALPTGDAGPTVDGQRVVRSGLQAGEVVRRQRPATRAAGHKVEVNAALESDGRVRDGASANETSRVSSSTARSSPRCSRWSSSLAGALALLSCRSASTRSVIPPTVVVRGMYPGANPKVIAETVASPLEQQMNGVEDMLYMSSQATTDGRMTLTITFALGTDLDTAQVQVQNRVAQALPRLPQEVQRIGLTTEKASPDIMMAAHLVSPDERYDMLYLSNYAHLQVKDELARIRRRRQRRRCSAPASTACGSGWTRTSWPRAT